MSPIAAIEAIDEPSSSGCMSTAST